MGIGRQYTKKSKISGVMDFSQPSTLGFRTRAAKNLALLRLLSHSPSAAPDADSFRYLQLRNRRLEKPLSLIESWKQQPKHHAESRNPKSKLAPAKSEDSAPIGGNNNLLDCESGDRSTRESTPCNFVTDSEAISHREIEEFFAIAEQHQQRLFTDKYNFDFVSENPLLGRYEWVKILQ